MAETCQTPNLAQRVVHFLEERRAEAYRLYGRVLAIGARLVMGGVAVLVTTQAVLVVYTYAYTPAWVLAVRVLGAAGFCWGVVILSTCPPEEVDLDSVVAKLPWSRLMCALAVAICTLIEACLVPPYVAALAVPFAIVGGSQKLCATCRTQATSCLAQFLAFLMLGYCGREVRLSFHDPRRIPNAAMWFVGFFALQCIFFRGHCTKDARGVRAGFSPTVVLHCAMYIFLASAGLVHVSQGISHYLDGTWGPNPIVAHCLTGLSFAFPPSLCVALGPKRLFGFFARRFDRNAARAMRDASFVAYLLDSAPLSVGDAWWELRNNGSPNVPGAAQDVQQVWRRGQVTQTGTESFTVEFPAEGAAGEDVREVPRPGKGSSCQELMEQAQHNLRCLDWENLTLDLLNCRSTGGAVPASHANRFFTLSRPLQQGEVIDFFLSHSWYDDAKEKYATLESIVSSFTRKHGRSPTFWLDIACIDQRSISDGLRALPINIMACKRMLVLCGATLPKRLWCVWELFTATAFFEDQVSQERIVLRVLGDETLNELLNFKLEEAKCFDPNEQARLRVVMSSIGEERLCKCIRSLAKQCVRKSWSLLLV